MTILCIDSGNTLLKWGLRSGEHWLAQGAVAHREAAQLQLPKRTTRLVACNVAGDSGRNAIEAIARSCDLTVTWVAARKQQCGVTSLYDPPEQLGADRWAALVGARSIHAGDCVVVMCGTATTIDILDANGVFNGGLILPGLDMMRNALADSTADLPPGRGEFRDLPRNTFDAITSGAIHATLGAIERLTQHMNGAAAPLCLLSGGAAMVLAPHMALPHRYVENLVLDGVARIAAAI